MPPAYLRRFASANSIRWQTAAAKTWSVRLGSSGRAQPTGSWDWGGRCCSRGCLPALLLKLFGETGLSHPSSDQGGLLNRKQDRFWMAGQERRGGLLRPEEEGLIAKGLSHTLATLGWQDQRHDTAGRGQIFDHSFGGGYKGDGVPGLRAARLDLG